MRMLGSHVKITDFTRSGHSKLRCLQQVHGKGYSFAAHQHKFTITLQAVPDQAEQNNAVQLD